jgi:7-cyano-7-deazaguanine synthase
VSPKTKHAVAVVSGGLDSTTLVYDLIDKGYTVDCLSFNYGQRHSVELMFARKIALLLELRHDIVDLRGLTHLISNSALTSDHKHAEGNDIIDVPEGHYAEDTMKQTVVPNRNMIMLSIAGGVAVNRGANTIATGVHAGDHFVYPDCRPEFIFAAGQALLAGNAGFHNFNTGEIVEVDMPDGQKRRHKAAVPITTPFLNSTKADIAYRALELSVPIHMTWSCYKGRDKHCGRCGTCVERLEAIDEAQHRMAANPPTWMESPYLIEDHTEYADTEYWKVAIAEARKKGESSK